MMTIISITTKFQLLLLLTCLLPKVHCDTYIFELDKLTTYIEPKQISPLGEIIAEVVASPPPFAFTIDKQQNLLVPFDGGKAYYGSIAKPTSQVPFPVLEFSKFKPHSEKSAKFSVENGHLAINGDTQFYSCDPATHTGYRKAVLAFYNNNDSDLDNSQDKDHNKGETDHCIKVHITAHPFSI